MNAEARAKAPSRFLLAMEARAIAELGLYQLALPLLPAMAKGDGHPVFVLPGFTAGEGSTLPMRAALRMRNFDAHSWGMGRNLGMNPTLPDDLCDKIQALRRRAGRRVSLVGWSLGGIIARELAREIPEDIRQVVTMGSPFNGYHRANHAWRLVRKLSGKRKVDTMNHKYLERLREPPPVPSTAIYSTDDGIVAWRACRERHSPTSESVRVFGSHLGLGHNPMVLYVLMDRLSQPEGRWQPFDLGGWRRVVYQKSYGE